jgi:hypothetical protein
LHQSSHKANPMRSQKMQYVRWLVMEKKGVHFCH